MSSTDLHQILFTWPHTEPSIVKVTGTFDSWAGTHQLTKTSTGFETTIHIPWNTKIKYKFIVDGQWLTHEDQPTEIDPGGYENNIYIAPPKPTLNTVLTPDEEIATNGVEVQPNDEKVEEEKPKHQNGGAKVDEVVLTTPGFLSELASTIVAREGTTSSLEYLASGLGAAVHSMVGVDPINSEKIAIPTPQVDEHFIIPEPVSETIPNLDSPPLSVAPRVPIMVVPVNAPENNTTTTAPPPPSVIIPLSGPIETPIYDSAPKADSILDETSPNPDVIPPPVSVTETVLEALRQDVDQPASALDSIVISPSLTEGTDFQGVLSEIAVLEPDHSTSTPALETEAIPHVTEALVDDIPHVSESLTPDFVEVVSPKVEEEIETTPPVNEVTKVDQPLQEALLTETEESTKESSQEVDLNSPPAKDVEESVKSEIPPVETVEPAKEATPPAQVTPPEVTVTEETTAETPKTNGHSSDDRPKTPTQKAQPFPTSASDSPSKSVASSRIDSTRKKRTSIFGKIKNIFHPDHDKKPKKTATEKK